MSRPLVSVVMCSFQRAHLLRRSLATYEDQQFDNNDFELVVVDDHSDDGTGQMVKDWSKRTGIQSVVLTASPKPAEWVDCGHWYNYGIRASSGKHVILTHPEIMVGRQSVALCVRQLELHKWLYACCRCYYLSPRDQERLDTVDWRTKGTLAVRDIEGFYDEDANGAADFTHKATDSVAQPGSYLATWESLVFGGCSRETWKKLGGLQRTIKWGSVDVLMMMRRKTLGITNHTCPEESSVVVHQSHDLPGNVMTPRVESVWKDELRDVNVMDPERLIYPFVDELGWG